MTAAKSLVPTKRKECINRMGNIKIMLIVAFMALLLGLTGVYYAITNGVIKIPGLHSIIAQPSAVQTKLVKVDFAYKIKSISASEIVLVAEKGTFILPYNIMTVDVYKGPTKASPKIPLTDLKVGDSVNMEFVAGKSATLFVSTL